MDGTSPYHAYNIVIKPIWQANSTHLRKWTIQFRQPRPLGRSYMVIIWYNMLWTNYSIFCFKTWKHNAKLMHTFTTYKYSFNLGWIFCKNKYLNRNILNSYTQKNIVKLLLKVVYNLSFCEQVYWRNRIRNSFLIRIMKNLWFFKFNHRA